MLSTLELVKDYSNKKKNFSFHKCLWIDQPLNLNGKNENEASALDSWSLFMLSDNNAKQLPFTEDSPQSLPKDMKKFSTKILCTNNSKNGAFCIFGLRDNNIIVWNTITDQHRHFKSPYSSTSSPQSPFGIKQLYNSNQNNLYQLFISNDGKFICLISTSEQVWFCDTTTTTENQNNNSESIISPQWKLMFTQFAPEKGNFLPVFDVQFHETFCKIAAVQICTLEVEEKLILAQQPPTTTTPSSPHHSRTRSKTTIDQSTRENSFGFSSPNLKTYTSRKDSFYQTITQEYDSHSVHFYDYEDLEPSSQHVEEVSFTPKKKKQLGKQKVKCLLVSVASFDVFTTLAEKVVPDRYYTIMERTQYSDDPSYYQIAVKKTIPEILLSWDSDCSTLAISVNSFEFTYDSKVYFYLPVKKKGWSINYGRRSYMDIAENRKSHLPQDAILFCIQQFCWTSNGLFVNIVDGKGNVSIVSRFGEFSWLKLKDHDTPTKFIKCKELTAQGVTATFQIIPHPKLQHIFALSDGCNILVFSLPELQITSLLLTFTLQNNSSAMIPNFSSYFTNLDSFDSIHLLWRLALSHPQSFTTTHPLFSLIEKISVYFSKMDSMLDVMLQYIKLLECLEWCVPDRNLLLVIPHIIKLLQTILRTSIPKNKVDVDVFMQMIALTEKKLNSIKRKVTSIIGKTPQDGDIFLKQFWVMVGQAILELTAEQANGSKAKSLAQRLARKSNVKLKKLPNSLPSPTHFEEEDVNNDSDMSLDSDEEELVMKYEQQNSITTTALERDLSLPLYPFLDSLVYRIKEHVDDIVCDAMDVVEDPKDSGQMQKILGHKQYLLGNIDKAIKYYKKLPNSLSSSVEALFVALLIKNDLPQALDLVNQQFQNKDIIQIKMEELIQKDSHVISSHGNRNIIESFAILLNSVYEEKQVYALAPIFCDQKVPLVTLDNNQKGVYYVALNSHQMTKSLLRIFKSDSAVGKFLVVRLWLSLEKYELAILFCCKFSLWHHATNIQFLITKENKKVSSSQIQLNFSPMEQMLQELLVTCLMEKPSRIKKILHVTELFSKSITNQLRHQLLQIYLQHLVEALKQLSPNLMGGINHNNNNSSSSDMKESSKDFITNLKQTIAWNRKVKPLPTIKETSNTTVEQNIYSLIHYSLVMLYTTPNSLLELVEESKSIATTDNILLTSFSQFCRYMFYMDLRCKLWEHGQVSFQRSYHVLEKREETSDMTIQRRQNKTIELANLCGLMLCFEELHTRAFVQGNFLTAVSLIQSTSVTQELIEKYLPNYEQVLDTLKGKYKKIVEKCKRVSTTEETEAIKVFTLEQSEEYWNFLTNALEVVQQNSLLKPKSKIPAEMVNQMSDSILSSKEYEQVQQAIKENMSEIEKQGQLFEEATHRMESQVTTVGPVEVNASSSSSSSGVSSKSSARASPVQENTSQNLNSSRFNSLISNPEKLIELRKQKELEKDKPKPKLDDMAVSSAGTSLLINMANHSHNMSPRHISTSANSSNSSSPIAEFPKTKKKLINLTSFKSKMQSDSMADDANTFAEVRRRRVSGLTPRTSSMIKRQDSVESSGGSSNQSSPVPSLSEKRKSDHDKSSASSSPVPSTSSLVSPMPSETSSASTPKAGVMNNVTKNSDEEDRTDQAIIEAYYNEKKTRAKQDVRVLQLKTIDEKEILDKYKKKQDDYSCYFEKEKRKDEDVRLFNVSKKTRKNKEVKLFKVETCAPKRKAEGKLIKLPVEKIVVEKIYKATSEKRIVTTEVQTSSIVEKESASQTLIQEDTPQINLNQVVSSTVREVVSVTREKSSAVPIIEEHMLFTNIRKEILEEKVNDLRSNFANSDPNFNSYFIPKANNSTVVERQTKPPRLRLATRINITASYEKYMEEFGVDIIPK